MLAAICHAVDRPGSWRCNVSHVVRNVAAVSMAAAVLGGLGGCGGDKPAYCQDKQDLQSSIDDLKAVDVRNDGLSAVRADLKNVQAAATTLVGTAKNEFGSQ